MLQRTALDALGLGAVVFTNYLSSSYSPCFSAHAWAYVDEIQRANEVARSEGRKGINASDVLRALDNCGYSDFAPRLRAELECLFPSYHYSLYSIWGLMVVRVRGSV